MVGRHLFARDFMFLQISLKEVSNRLVVLHVQLVPIVAQRWLSKLGANTRPCRDRKPPCLSQASRVKHLDRFGRYSFPMFSRKPMMTMGLGRVLRTRYPGIIGRFIRQYLWEIAGQLIKFKAR